METFQCIRTKRAVRKFTPTPIPQETLTRILEAGRWAGSAKNRQPWSFVVVRSRATLEGLSRCGPYAGHLAEASVGVALVTEGEGANWTVPFDLGRAAQNMMLAGWEAGVGSVVAAIYDRGKASALLGLPAGLVVYVAISFGYPAPAQPPPPVPRGRKPLGEIIHWERW